MQNMRPPAARRTGKLMAQNTPLSFQFVPFCATLIFFFAFHPPINLRALLFAFTSVRLLIDICARFSTTFPAAHRFPPLSLPFFLPARAPQNQTSSNSAPAAENPYLFLLYRLFPRKNPHPLPATSTRKTGPTASINRDAQKKNTALLHARYAINENRLLQKKRLVPIASRSPRTNQVKPSFNYPTQPRRRFTPTTHVSISALLSMYQSL